MYKTCQSCGTVFELDETILSQNIHWLKCSVCNKKWSLSENQNDYLDKKIIFLLKVKNNKIFINNFLLRKIYYFLFKFLFLIKIK